MRPRQLSCQKCFRLERQAEESWVCSWDPGDGPVATVRSSCKGAALGQRPIWKGSELPCRNHGIASLIPYSFRMPKTRVRPFWFPSSNARRVGVAGQPSTVTPPRALRIAENMSARMLCRRISALPQLPRGGRSHCRSVSTSSLPPARDQDALRHPGLDQIGGTF